LKQYDETKTYEKSIIKTAKLMLFLVAGGWRWSNNKQFSFFASHSEQ